jgi:hypothetical protein
VIKTTPSASTDALELEIARAHPAHVRGDLARCRGNSAGATRRGRCSTSWHSERPVGLVGAAGARKVARPAGAA